MTITVLTFATARGVFGFDEKMLTIDSDTPTPASILDSLRSDWREKLPGTRVAIDLEYADWNQPLRDGQTLAVIPPVSGG